MRTFFLKRPQVGLPLPNGFVQWCADIDKAVANINVHFGAVSWNQGIPTILTRNDLYGAGGTGGSFPWGSNYTFGITSTASDKIKVWKGKFRRWGDQTYVAADTEVTFSGDGDQWLVWRWSESSGLEIVTTPQTNYPVEADSTYIYGPIHKVNLTAGVFTLLDACQDGIINAPIFTIAGT
jgi:hypothetical protein